jgi:hypothetical protein
MASKEQDRHLKPQTNVRLSEEARALLEAFREHWGISASGVVELLLREESRRRGWRVRKNTSSIKVDTA